jgi:5S rRNA maturation endonuclease (ribonuclease M5)
MAAAFFSVAAEHHSVVELFQALTQKLPISQVLSLDQARSAYNSQQVDVHLLSRFLKELATHPCMLLTGLNYDQSLVRLLFPHVEIVEVSSAQTSRDDLIERVKNFTQVHGGYAVVLTNLDAIGLQIQHLLNRHVSQICHFAIDGLLSRILHGVDIIKLERLMKRKIHVLCTAAILPIKYEERKQQYTRALKRVSEFCYKPYIVESCVPGPTFLNDLSTEVLHTLSNNPHLKNKGVNEFVSMIKAFEHWSFNDDDIIVKLTGRYFFQNDAFLRFLEDSSDIDCAAKFVTVPAGPTKGVDAVLTGCFAMRCDLFKQMLTFFDYDWLEREMMCVEHVVGPYLNTLATKGIKVSRQDRLHVEANMFYTQGSDEISYW